MKGLGLSVLLPLFTACAAPARERSAAGVAAGAREGIRSIAYRVHDLEAMTAFYSEAFGVTFHEVETFGVLSRFGDLAGVTLKLVPIREDEDFVGYPDLQLGLVVDDLDRVIELALEHGGALEAETIERADLRHGSVRDPDGNTLELYERRR